MNRFLIPAGLALIGAGLASLVWIYRQLEFLFNQPDQIKLLTYLKDSLKDIDRTVDGTIDGKTFTLTLPESVFTIACMIILMMALGLLIGLINALIGNGVSLLKAASRHKAPEEEIIRSRQIT